MKKIVSSLAALAVLLMPVGAINALAVDSQIEIKTVSAKAGDTDVVVPIEITANAGVVGMSVFFEYDAKALKLEKVEDGKLFADMSFTPTGKLDLQPFNILFENALATENYTNVGTLAVLHFSVLEGAADGTYPIKLALDAEATFDVNMDNVPFNAVSGAIVIGNGTTTTAPAVTTAAPVVSTSAAPATTTAAPATTTAAPATTTAAPATTTAAPATTTAAPATTTAAPVETTTASVVTTTAAPVETTTASVVTTTAAPVVTTTAAPATTTAAPVVTTTAAPVVTTTAAPATTTAAPATTEAATTAAKSGYTLEQLADMAEKDYEDKHTGSDVSAAAVQNADGSVTITLTGKDGKVVSTYIVDAQTGKGKDEKGSSVDLPQTGVNGYGAFAAVAGAFAMVGAGAWLTVAVAKKKDEE